MNRFLWLVSALALGGALVVSCTGGAGSSTPSPTPGALALDDFPFLQLGMNYNEIVARVGEPAPDEGSGVYAYVYPLQDGSELILTFLRLESLESVVLYNPGDGSRQVILGPQL
ncbi:MAG TPA: hypothetical protein VJJ46_06105 [Anaerolineales bacterium]|nr:hypothetical protein [Anaerolineales bacterium]